MNHKAATEKPLNEARNNEDKNLDDQNLEDQKDNSVVPNKRKTQRYLGDKGLIILIGFLSAFIPLSTDLYLPALPNMAEKFHTSAGLVNLTLIFFFIFYALGTLFWGPLSDKYGRRPILLTGLALYVLSSILCANAADITQLIVFRILQAVGSGAATAVSTAMVKDVYEGRKRESVLALVQSMAMISPIVAPAIGAFILGFTTWRGVFWALAVIGLIATAAGFALEETIERRNSGGIFQSLGRLGVVAQNRGFTSLLLTFSLMSIPSMAFISASSYIYIDNFNLSEKQYSFYFAVNAVFLVMGPLLYIQLSKFVKRTALITLSYTISAISGLLICMFGQISPWVFAVSLLPATLAGSVIRPPSTHMMLEQLTEDAGAASSFMSCTFTVMSCIGMLLISLNWGNRILVMGAMYVIVAVITLLVWSVLSKKPFLRGFSKPAGSMEE